MCSDALCLTRSLIPAREAQRGCGSALSTPMMWQTPSFRGVKHLSNWPMAEDAVFTVNRSAPRAPQASALRELVWPCLTRPWGSLKPQLTISIWSRGRPVIKPSSEDTAMLPSAEPPTFTLPWDS